MKRIRIIVMVSMCLMMTSYCFASTLREDKFVHEYVDENITVIFQENTNFSYEKQLQIADSIVLGQENSVTTYALCGLIGHNLTTEIVTAVEHKVSSSSPRCVQTSYKVITCSRCDYEEIGVMGSTYIYCCPEDSTSTVSD